MHEKGVLAGFRDQPFVHLIRPEHFEAILELMLHAHTRPNVGVNRVGTLHRIRFRKPFDVLVG